MKQLATLTIATSLVLTTLSVDPIICGIHEVLSNGSCVCKKGYVRHNTACQRCPDHSFFDCNHNTCKCEPTYNWDASNFVCKLKPVIAPIQPISSIPIVQPNPINPVIKPNPTAPVTQPNPTNPVTQANPIAISIPVIQPNPIIPITQPKPSNPTNPVIQPQSSIISCPVNSFYNPPAFRCDCNYGFVWNAAKTVCINACGVNQILLNSGCACKDGFVRHFGTDCVTCPSGSFLNPPAYRCDCPYGQSFNAGKTQCINSCGVNEIFVNNACQCRDGFVKHNGNVCVTCPSGSFLNPPAFRCDCMPGLKWNSGKTQCTW